MRFELEGANLAVMPDSPFLRSYKVDYVNMARDTSGNVAINTQIASVSPTASGAGAAAGAGNVSSTRVENVARNRFWETLEKNIKDILRETDKILPEGSSETVVESLGQESTTGTGTASSPAGRGNGPPSIAASPNPASLERSGTTVVKRATFREAASVIVNPETGVLFVRATSRQHEKVQEFLDRVLASAKRQVLIEATIVEVRLNESYQQGIDWQYLRSKSAQLAIGQGATTQSIDPLGGAFTSVASTLPSGVADSLFTLAFRNGGFTAALRLLESFGTLKVLSSPKLSVLNNQTALLKVVDNVVYFTVKADTTQTQTSLLTTFTTTPQSVSVGLVMSVTPQIGAADAVLLNVRPTISRVTGFRRDPNPGLGALVNEVPEIQTREMESLMVIGDGEIAVLGGLMQDELNNTEDTLPGLSKIPLLGNLFKHRNGTSTRTELVVFLRPTVVKEPGVQGSFGSFRGQMPDGRFFVHAPQPAPDSGGHSR
jgi:general secretion pathway protein D